MASTNENLPEVAHGTSYPEVYSNPQDQHLYPQQEPWSPQQSSVNSTGPTNSYAKTEDYQSLPQVVPGQNRGHGHSSEDKGKRGTILGCAPIVFILSVVIALLFAVVIGLAAGTGVSVGNYKSEHDRYQDLQSSYSALQATKTSSAAGSGQTGSPNYSKITNGCSDDNESVTGTTYKPEFFGKPTFTMHCNKDFNSPPFYSLFTADFNGCMSACASWNMYNPSNKTCEGVSFIPLWSQIADAVKGNAPGDCYVKPGPATANKIQTPNIGTEVHAAILKRNGNISK
ncbi:hypothetical protein QQS21_002350 [Conoideocrella luteorostrata]|uniref:Uncharacterized protein n=1 Tax=Conoideocrella luteorostrata TaxID=1105319 RepID=A0AAJ0FXE2_9HYPO|nr:hypothetical protein QQS21_002350 [Conoideocrella luteorostrata]